MVKGSCIIRNAPRPWLSCPIDGKRQYALEKELVKISAAF